MIATVPDPASRPASLRPLAVLLTLTINDVLDRDGPIHLIHTTSMGGFSLARISPIPSSRLPGRLDSMG